MVSASSGLLPLGGVGNENFSNVKRVIFVRDSRDIVIVKQKMRSNWKTSMAMNFDGEVKVIPGRGVESLVRYGWRRLFATFTIERLHVS